MPVAQNTQTGEVQAAVLPFYKSPVAVGVLVSMAFKTAAIFFPAYVPLGFEEQVTQMILALISLGGDLVALIARWRSGLQPLSVATETKN
jgi:hypothetical protein